MEKWENTNVNPPYFYRATLPSAWTGRVDGSQSNMLRWHQLVKILDISTDFSKEKRSGVAFMGFATDEGVRRNQGRIGAADGPQGIRAACSTLPYWGTTELWDTGDVLCPQGKLEQAQQELGAYVERLLHVGLFPILLGGGHEITYGHYRGIAAAYPDSQIGIINLDAHFDLRIPGTEGVNSGTGFYQVAQDCQAQNKTFHYMALGIQRHANIQTLFQEADRLGVQYVLDRDIESLEAASIAKRIADFAAQVDHLYLSVDLDVFSGAYAPGVSASSARGLVPGFIVDFIFDCIRKTGKLVSLDIAEYNPQLDIDQRTAKLAASIIFDQVMERH